MGACDEAAFSAGGLRDAEAAGSCADASAVDRSPPPPPIRVDDAAASRRRVAFVHVPKTGGSAVEDWLRRARPRRLTLSGHHALTLAAHQKRVPDATTLVTLREPVERFESTHAYGAE